MKNKLIFLIFYAKTFFFKDLRKKFLISIEKLRNSLKNLESIDNGAFRVESKESWMNKIKKINSYLNLIEVFYPLNSPF